MFKTVSIKLDTSKIFEDNTDMYSERRQPELPSRKILRGRLLEAETKRVIRVKGNSA
jgi:hypothetical protein